MQLRGHRCIFSKTVVASPLKLMNSSVMETVMVLYILAISTWSIKDFPWGNIAKKRFQRFRTMFDSNWYQFDIKLKLSLKVNFQLILFHSRHFWRETDKTDIFFNNLPINSPFLPLTILGNGYNVRLFIFQCNSLPFFYLFKKQSHFTYQAQHSLFPVFPYLPTSLLPTLHPLLREGEVSHRELTKSVTSLEAAPRSFSLFLGWAR